MLVQAKATTAAHLGEDYDTLLGQTVGATGEAVTCEHMRNCFFGSYVDSSKAAEERSYAEVADVPALITTMETHLVDHNGKTCYLHGHAISDKLQTKSIYVFEPCMPCDVCPVMYALPCPQPFDSAIDEFA